MSAVSGEAKPTSTKQLRAILWKNWLLKRAAPFSLAAEILLPVVFMSLLILIKSITNVLDSPNVAYSCGNVYPWYYSLSLTPSGASSAVNPFECTVKPATCAAENYYQDEQSFQINPSSPSEQSYLQYGYVSSPASGGQTFNPFYAYTLADQTAIYLQAQMTNPSLPITQLLLRLSAYHSIFAVAPLNEGSGPSDTTLAAQRFATYLQGLLPTPRLGLQTVVYFSSQSAVESYITSISYDDAGYAQGKVAFAVIFNNVDVATAQWDYAIRANYTSGQDQQYSTVACLNGPTLYKTSTADNETDDTVAPVNVACEFTFSIPSTKFYTNNLAKPQSASNYFGYSYSGYSTIQVTLDKFIFQQYNAAFDTLQASVSLMPTTSYLTDNFQSIISSTLGIFYMLSFLYPVSAMVRALVLDKETRVKEGMKMMGLSDFVYSFSWSVTLGTQMTLVAVLITLITATSVFEYSNKILVFLYFEFFSIAVINFVFLLSTLFSKSKTASLLGPLIFFASFFPYYAVSDAQFATSVKTASCLLAPTCFALGATVFADYEGGLVGVQPANANTLTSNFSYALCVGMLFFDSVLYGALAWYLDKVLPSEFGTPLPFYFLFTKSYWNAGHSNKNSKNLLGMALSALFSCFGVMSAAGRGKDHKAPLLESSHHGDYLEGARGPTAIIVDGDSSSGAHKSGHGINSDKSHESSLARRTEVVTADLLLQKAEQRTVSLVGLRKVYLGLRGQPDTGRVAVDGLSLDMYEGQVTCLLGHNGAGKSTTISCLVGLTPPSGGDAIVRGLSINEDMSTIRKNLGVCPQHDILFPELTVIQHLELFAAFKGLSAGSCRRAAEEMIAEVGLVEKTNARSKSLSGGQKRKLSLAIALIGGSKVVILDEPTSGMDPYSRRSTWNVIQKNKKGRILLLTTHFMDEADVLGDRIAIMAHGRLQCVGSSLFLKGAYGVGYTLTIVKIPQQSQQLPGLLTCIVPEAELLSDVGKEVSYRLPFAASARFPALFEALDTLKGTADVAGEIVEYGVAVTTLEEVFMRVGKDETLAEEAAGVGNAAIDKNAVSVKKPALSFDGISTSAAAVNPLVPVDSNRGKAEDDVDIGTKATQNNRQSVDKSKFSQHLTALLIKRLVYGKRDTRMFVCQLLVPVLLVIIGVALLQAVPSLQQPDLVLSPSANQYNQNFVPFLLSSDSSATTSVSSRILEQFNGQNVAGVAVPVNASSVSTSNGNPDPYLGCDQGAQPLMTMNQFLLTENSATSTQIANEDGSSRYGAITLDSSLTNDTSLVYNAMINSSANHGVGVYVNLVHNAYFQVLTGLPEASITAHNFPLPPTNKQELQSATASAFVVSLFCMIAFCFIPASFGSFVVKEREVKAKHQQVVSGMNIYAYWVSTMLWDVGSYLLTPLLLLAVVNAFSVEAYTQGDAAGAFATLLFLFGPSVAAFTYLVSFLFSSHSSAQIIIMFLNFVTGLCLMIVSFVLTSIDSTSEINLSLRYLYLLFPSFCLGDGLLNLALCVNGESCPVIASDGYSFIDPQTPWQLVANNLGFMAGQTVVYFGAVLAIEYALTFPSLYQLIFDGTSTPQGNDVQQDAGLRKLLETEDEDVRTERRRVLAGEFDDNTQSAQSASAVVGSGTVCLKELRKVYPRNNALVRWIARVGHQCGLTSPSILRQTEEVKIAVQSLCFHVSRGEVFGFLGINGAGKTTTLSILSGEFPPTSGKASIDGYSSSTDQVQIRKRIGYCPQFDALLELLSVREHLELFARIKGIRGKEELESVVQEKLHQLDLVDFESKLAGTLSGGNKRKLSLAIALIGNPLILFLDEPSTGMDPTARRFMWDVIAKVSTRDALCSVILTTHSMEEAEALSSRIGVIVNGALKCLGSSHHLKERFGSGYEVQVKLASPSESELGSLARLLAEQGVLQLQSQSSDVDDAALLEALGVALMPSRAVVERACQVLGWELPRIAIAMQDTDASNSGEFGGFLGGGSNGVSVAQFLRWFASEKQADVLSTFLSERVSPQVALLERSAALRFTYTVPKSAEFANDSSGGSIMTTQTSFLARLFSLFEENKQSLQISEYSIGQTTLEQIFNHFASSQENPENKPN